jgi:hypothetical protein
MGTAGASHFGHFADRVGTGGARSRIQRGVRRGLNPGGLPGVRGSSGTAFDHSSLAALKSRWSSSKRAVAEICSSPSEWIRAWHLTQTSASEASGAAQRLQAIKRYRAP